MVVMLAAALLAVLVAIALIGLFAASLPPAHYGPFGGAHALTGSVVLMALFVAVAVRSARGVSPEALILLLITAGPVGRAKPAPTWPDQREDFR